MLREGLGPGEGVRGNEGGASIWGRGEVLGEGLGPGEGVRGNEGGARTWGRGER